MDKQRKKEILTEYKLQKVTGGVYRIHQINTERSLIKADVNLGAVQNRYSFSIKINSCPMLKLQQDWNQYGKDSFRLEILEETEQGNLEDLRAFKDRLKHMEQEWIDKYESGGLY